MNQVFYLEFGKQKPRHLANHIDLSLGEKILQWANIGWLIDHDILWLCHILRLSFPLLVNAKGLNHASLNITQS